MSISNKIKRIIKKIVSVLLPPEDHTVYISQVSRNAPWVFIAYIPEVFYHQDDSLYLKRHQNMQESLVMVPIFNRLGYNVYVQGFTETKKLPDIDVRVIFGHPPAIEQAAKKYKNALVVKYATGCYYEHQNSQEKYITDLINSRHGTSFLCERWVTPYYAHLISDRILMIGSKNTIETYPVAIQNKITTIHQSSQKVRTLSEIKYAKDNDFFFMSSGGVLLRGVSFLIEYFSAHREKRIHIVCPIEPYLKFVQETIPPNVVLHGVQILGSDELLEIMSHCNYIIYPSGSDGGVPGSVINSMKNGLVPIVSRWAAFDEIDKYGFVMPGWDVSSVEKGIQWTESISSVQCEKMKQECAVFAKETYSIERFSEEFESFFMEVTKSIKQ